MLQRYTENLFQSLSKQNRIHKLTRKYSSRKFIAKQFEEISIKVPWGHVAGKWYGPKHVRPLVGLHGWQDNAGTFDTLAPLLPTYTSFLSIDLPGHGLSSWLPNGMSYHTIDYVVLLRYIMDELGWDKISIIAHSMSAMNTFVFSAIFPDKIDLNISLDAVKPLHRHADTILDYKSKRIDGFLKYVKRLEEKSEPPSYTYDELIDRLYLGTNKSVDKECCKYLLKRNTKPTSSDAEKYYFSRDNRIKYSFFYTFPQEVPKEMAMRIKCPHLFIKASKSPYYEDKIYFDEILEILAQKSNFEFHSVDGTHHVHLNEPEKISKIVNNFINKYKT